MFVYVRLLIVISIQRVPFIEFIEFVRRIADDLGKERIEKARTSYILSFEFLSRNSATHSVSLLVSNFELLTPQRFLAKPVCQMSGALNSLSSGRT